MNVSGGILAAIIEMQLMAMFQQYSVQSLLQGVSEIFNTASTVPGVSNIFC